MLSDVVSLSCFTFCCCENTVVGDLSAVVRRVALCKIAQKHTDKKQVIAWDHILELRMYMRKQIQGRVDVIASTTTATIKCTLLPQLCYSGTMYNV